MKALMNLKIYIIQNKNLKQVLNQPNQLINQLLFLQIKIKIILTNQMIKNLVMV